MSRAARTIFVCSDCGAEAPKWSGRCAECGAWNTLAERAAVAHGPTERPSIDGERPRPLSKITIGAEPRRTIGFAEVDRLLGGGLVAGSVILVGGDPGIGKSTLLLQVADRVSRAGQRVLYISGEESVAQTKLRAERIGAAGDHILLACETNLGVVLRDMAETRPFLAIVDSIQMMYKPDLPGAPGTVTQVRECATDLVYHAKRHGTVLFLIGHVTKEGTLAGPRTLEHLVDTVLYFEGDRHQSFRILRAVKNRFGSTNELAVFEMGAAGLQAVDNPSALFLSLNPRRGPGAAIVSQVVGSRTLLAEVQALTAPANYGTPARRVSGVDSNRVAMILAVLERRAGYHLGMQDVFVNAVGGMTLDEPASDLGIALAIASSFRDRPLPARMLCVGEVGLGGEVRAVAQAASRLREARLMGFERALVPPGTKPEIVPEGLTVQAVATVSEAIEVLT